MITWRDCLGWFDWPEIYDEVAATTPEGATVVELGSFMGRSTLYLAQRIKESGKKIDFVAVDRWTLGDDLWVVTNPDPNDKPMFDAAQSFQAVLAAHHNSLFEVFCHNLAESGLADYVRVIRADSMEAALCVRVPVDPHFVFVDASHDYESVQRDLRAWLPTQELVPGWKWAAGHDYTPDGWPGLKKAVHEHFGERNVVKQGNCWVVRR